MAGKCNKCETHYDDESYKYCPVCSDPLDNTEFNLKFKAELESRLAELHMILEHELGRDK